MRVVWLVMLILSRLCVVCVVLVFVFVVVMWVWILFYRFNW